jgi:hypothetical protein
MQSSLTMKSNLSFEESAAVVLIALQLSGVLLAFKVSCKALMREGLAMSTKIFASVTVSPPSRFWIAVCMVGVTKVSCRGLCPNNSPFRDSSIKYASSASKSDCPTHSRILFLCGRFVSSTVFRFFRDPRPAATVSQLGSASSLPASAHGFRAMPPDNRSTEPTQGSLVRGVSPSRVGV